VNVSINWLRELAPDMEGTAAELADLLSMRAVMVEEIEPVGEGLGDLLVARVVEAKAHPNADRLTLCRVDTGGKAPVSVVCGAPNVEGGALYPYIPPGGTLPNGFQIQSRKLRGEMSHGMLCSEKELGLGRDASGILRLSDEHVPGARLVDALGLPDARLVLDLTPNRVDLAGHVGVARELGPRGVAGITLRRFGEARWSPEWVSGEHTASAAGVRVTIEDPDRCFRYLAAIVRGVRIGPSPEWLASRLRAVGARPIHNVVDATNHVLLELNQPVHAFDLARLEGPEIRVRAAAGEPFRTLDGVEHELGSVASVIADRQRPVALAGVMGGEESEVTALTTDVLIECASFDPGHTRRTANATGLATDASYRFERGIDEGGLEAALVRCVELILATAGGQAEPVAVRVGRKPPGERRIELRPARVRGVLGLDLDQEEIAALLEPVGFTRADDAEAAMDERPLLLRIPSWRGDVGREVDLLEEVARRHGYDAFPSEPWRVRPSSVPSHSVWARGTRVRRLLVAHGFLESRSSPMVPETIASEGAVRLLRPLSADESCLRTDLVPVLLRRLEHNFSRSHRDVRLFEIGTVFAHRPTAEGASAFPEEVRVGLVMTGLREPAHWSVAPDMLDLWDLKGLTEELSEGLGLGWVVPAEEGGIPGEEDALVPLDGEGWLAPSGFAIMGVGGPVGMAGAVRPDAFDAPPWVGSVWAAEFRLAAVSEEEPALYHALPAFPAVPRDLALSLPRNVRAADVEEAMRDAAPDFLESVRLFDVYEGEEIGEGRRSLAWRLVFRAVDRTLRDAEVEAAVARVIAALEAKFDVRIRSA